MHLMCTDKGMKQWPGSHLMLLKAIRAAQAVMKQVLHWARAEGLSHGREPVCVPKASRARTLGRFGSPCSVITVPQDKCYV